MDSNFFFNVIKNLFYWPRLRKQNLYSAPNPLHGHQRRFRSLLYIIYTVCSKLSLVVAAGKFYFTLELNGGNLLRPMLVLIIGVLEQGEPNV